MVMLEYEGETRTLDVDGLDLIDGEEWLVDEF